MNYRYLATCKYYIAMIIRCTAEFRLVRSGCKLLKLGLWDSESVSQWWALNSEGLRTGVEAEHNQVKDGYQHA